MSYDVGLDVSLKEVFVCIVDEKGTVAQQFVEICDPEVIGTRLLKTQLDIVKIGLESGSVTHWLTKGLRRLFLWRLER